ncbi:cytochrome c oxidase assembly protein COX20, mitochondrial-like isoform X2 [Hydractinia symbiolongicarpus]|uniref:cytochrome c oxidase assembly protein COX20, mitochondrial-like isoform X2 n=1 Tax=Hydractinia symbiolongicarpus TaxID=13093 RepID=UPI0025509C48|nr:cytochrome c oxidase assembly protein COX20, mitochondrial-like isoform X2 [Hydractinia symbiolongicarpus]
MCYCWDLSHFISETPCVRSSLLFGISCGLTIGLGMGLYSKRIKKSCDIAVGSFIMTSLGSWSYCYYSRWQRFQNMEAIIKVIDEKNRKNEEKERR